MVARQLMLGAVDQLEAFVLSACGRLFGMPGDSLSDVELSAAECELGVTLPPSYRTFLRYYGSDLTHPLEFLGLPRDLLARDIVLANQTDPRRRLPTLVKIAEDSAGCSYWLDTLHADSTGECPVLAQIPREGDRMVRVADSFVRFLEQVDAVLASRTSAQKA